MKDISNFILKTIENVENNFNVGWAIFIAALPNVLFLGYLTVYFSNRNARNRGRAVFSAFSDICTYLFCALCLFSAYVKLDIEFGVLSIGFALVLKAEYLLLYGILSVFPSYKEKPRKKRNEGEYFDLSNDYPVYTANSVLEPKKVRCYSEEIPETECAAYPSDVRLNHIFSVIERLKGASLGAGDRLEIEKYEELLTVYKNKTLLSSEEAQTLNDILASLLKLMAKYDI